MDRRQSVRRIARQHPVVSYFVLAYAISWLAWLPGAVGTKGVAGNVGFYIGGFGPALAALVITWLSGSSMREWLARIVRWRVHPGWYAVAFGLPLLLAVAFNVELALLRFPITTDVLPRRLALYLPTLAVIALAGGGNEEPGWRGFALPRLLERMTPLKATLVLATVWALWHIPTFAVDAQTQAEITFAVALPIALVRLVHIATYAFWLTWMYNRTRSVLLCILLHAGFNLAAGPLLLLPDVPFTIESYQPVLFATTLLLVGLAALLAGATRGRLGLPTAAPPPSAQLALEPTRKAA